MTKQLLRRLILLIGLLVFVAGIAYYSIKRAPKADEIVNVDDEIVRIRTLDGLPEKSSSTIWGKITYASTNLPASGVSVTIAGVGHVTDTQGNYALSVSDEGTVVVSFETASHGTYAPIDPTTRQLTLTKGDNIHKDFVIEKITQ